MKVFITGIVSMDVYPPRCFRPFMNRIWSSVRLSWLTHGLTILFRRDYLMGKKWVWTSDTQSPESDAMV